MHNLQKHAGTFTYAKKPIAFSYWSHTKGSDTPDTVLFLGAGQVGKIPYWVAQAAGPGVVVVDGLPHWESDPDKWNIETFARGYVECVFLSVLQQFGLSSMYVMAESQAAPAAVALVASAPAKIRNLVLIRPLGFTVAAYGKTPEERFANFRRRILQTQLQTWHSLISSPRTVQVGLLAYRAIRKEPNKKALYQKYTAGISYDLTEDCRQAANALHRQGSTFTMLLGEKDRIFPAHEILHTLRQANIAHLATLTLPGTPHGSLAVRASKVILDQALRIVRTTPGS
jgi:pimeloyl-ACP methyl ester carboxylesterase